MSVKLDPNNSQLVPFYEETGDGINALLPDEIMLNIFINLNDSELKKCRQVCKRWQALATDTLFLKIRYSEPAEAFGKEKWEKHFGKIGEVPRLPDNIHQILESPCPIHEGKKIKDTHKLVLIVKEVNGKRLTVNYMGELAGKLGTGYRFIPQEIVNEHGDTPIEESEYVLWTENVLPLSRSKSFTEQQTLVQELSQKAGAEYHVPKLIEAITCIFAEYASSKTRLYSDSPWTYTRCQEKTQGYQLVVGGFAPAGLFVYDDDFVDDFGGVGALRKFKAIGT